MQSIIVPPTNRPSNDGRFFFALTPSMGLRLSIKKSPALASAV